MKFKNEVICRNMGKLLRKFYKFINDFYGSQEKYEMYMEKCKSLDFQHSQHWLSVEEKFIIGDDFIIVWMCRRNTGG